MVNRKTYNVMMSVVHALTKVCNDLDFIAKDQVPPCKHLLNEVNNTVLDASVSIKDITADVITAQAKAEVLERERIMLTDFLSEKDLMGEYLKFTEKYD